MFKQFGDLVVSMVKHSSKTTIWNHGLMGHWMWEKNRRFVVTISFLRLCSSEVGPTARPLFQLFNNTADVFSFKVSNVIKLLFPSKTCSRGFLENPSFRNFPDSITHTVRNSFPVNCRITTVIHPYVNSLCVCWKTLEVCLQTVVLWQTYQIIIHLLYSSNPSDHSKLHQPNNHKPFLG